MTNLIAGCAVLIMAFGSGGAIVQSQFSNTAKTQETADASTKEREKILLDRIEKLEEIARHSAREPVEKATLDAIITASDKRNDLMQAQISDINRQIAAALIIIDNNNQVGVKKLSPSPP
jgi:hypothetical protein